MPHQARLVLMLLSSPEATSHSHASRQRRPWTNWRKELQAEEQHSQLTALGQPQAFVTAA